MLWRILDSNGDNWTLRKHIGMSNRLIRAICQAHPSRFLSSNDGMKLVKNATQEQVRHSAARIRSQAKKMIARAEALEGCLDG
jgi:hypothetical protein